MSPNPDQFKPGGAQQDGGFNNKNLIIAILLSLVILGGFHFFYEQPRLERLEQQKEQIAQTEPKETGALEGASSAPQTAQTTRPQSRRLDIDSPSIKGTLDLTGARLDDLSLKNYDVSLDNEAPVHLLKAGSSANPYYGEFGWTSQESGIRLPDENSVWQTAKGSNERLTPESNVTIFWNNGQGLRFERVISIDENYLFTVEQRVINNMGRAISLYPTAQITRKNVDLDTGALFILHEGPIGYIDEELYELDYDDLIDDTSFVKQDQGGWLGFTDKYWLTALLPDTGKQNEMRFTYEDNQGFNSFMANVRGAPIEIATGATVSHTQHFFAGAKRLSVLDSYEESLGVTHLDLAIDFGWFYFITKPFFLLISFLYGLVGNFGVAIVIFTILLRLCLFPLANKSYRSMAKMKKITPKLQKLKERYGDDRVAMQQKIMELYQKEKVSPLSGCAPILVQIPIFFALYKVLYVTIEMRHAPFFGWIQDLSQPDPTSIFNLFGLLPFDPPSFLMIGAWPVIMCLTLVLQQQLNPKPQDPLQAKLMGFFPFVMTFILAGFPAGLVIYWTFSNMFSVAQQYVIMRSMGVPIGRKANREAEANNDDGDHDGEPEFIDNDEAQRKRRELKQKKKELADKAKKGKKKSRRKKK